MPAIVGIYKIGQIDTKELRHHSAWIAPDGTWYSVQIWGHADAMVHFSENGMVPDDVHEYRDMYNHGWIRFSEQIWPMVPRRFTRSQRETIRAWEDVTGRVWPYWDKVSDNTSYRSDRFDNPLFI